MTPESKAYLASSASSAIISNRLSFCFQLKGVSLSLDTACSSSLVALDVGSKFLSSSACSAALCGGVYITQDKTSLLVHLAGWLSSIGRCATFDSSSDGFALGEGCAALWLTTPTKQAETQDTIATVSGLAVQHAGGTSKLTSPSGNSQQAVLRSALRDSGLAESANAVVECHGTATPLGDTIEVGALLSVMRNSKGPLPLSIGTIKTNVGHTESASGMLGLRKCILQMSRSVVSPNLHLRQLNKHLAEASKASSSCMPQYPTEL